MHGIRSKAWVGLFCAAAVWPALGGEPAAAGASAAPPQRLRIGLALSGGGARGFSHVGVLRALEAMRIPIDCIAGTSAGSAVGAAYALGMSPDEIEASLGAADWDNDIFNDQPARPQLPFRAKERLGGAPIGVTLGWGSDGIKTSTGVFAGQKIELFLHSMLGVQADYKSFDAMPIPFRAMATDLVTGAMVEQDHGSLVHAVRASMAVPSAFAPVKVGPRLLVDGGLTQNLPVQTVKKMCADRVIAVNIGSPLLQPNELTGVFSVAMQIVSILMERNVTESLAALGPQDVLITPDLGTVSAVDFARGIEGIPAGEAATLAAREVLAAWALPQAEYQAWQDQRQAQRGDPPTVQRVQVAHTRFVPQAFFTLKGWNQERVLKASNADKLERKILQWSGSGHFTSIAYAVRPDGDGYTLWVDPQEKPWGPDYLQIGFAGRADSHANADFSVKAAVRRTWLNTGGGEWQAAASFGLGQELETRWIQPLGVDSPWYVEPRWSVSKQPKQWFVGQRSLGEFSIDRMELEMGAGLQGALGELHLGAVRAHVQTKPRIGLTGVQPFESRMQGLRLRAVYDQLDALDFPRAGHAVRTEVFWAKPLEEHLSPYKRAEVDAMVARSWGEHTLKARAYLGSVSAAGGNILDVISVGGFQNLSGFQAGQFLVRGLGMGSLSYYRRLVGLPQLFGSGVYAGASLEYAHMRGPLGMVHGARLRRGGGSVFLGTSTVLGPAYVGLGLGQGGAKTLYLFLGRP